MSRIGALQPIDVETPHGNVRVSSRYRMDKQSYRLRLYGTMQAVQWLLPKRSVTALSDGMARDEISHPADPIRTIAALDQFRRALIARWEDRLELGANDPAMEDGARTVQAVDSPKTFGTLVDRYLAVHRVHLRPSTASTYAFNLAHWLRIIGRRADIGSISADAIKLGMADISTASSPAMANSCLRVLKVVLNYAVAEGYLHTLPHNRVGKLPAPPRAPKWWTREEVAQVLAAARRDPISPRDALLLFALAIYAGLRKGELDRLDWADLILDGDCPVCTVRSTATELTKSGKSRHIPISRELKAILIEFRQGSGLVLRSEKPAGKWKYRFECDTTFKRVVMAASVSLIRLHDMRHTFATLMLQVGVPMFEVSRWLGHGDIKTTQEVHAHLSPYDVEVDLLSIPEIPTAG